MTAIRILFLSASPDDRAYLQVDREARAIAQRVRSSEYPDAIEVITKPALRPSDLQEALLRHTPHIVHFSGHGQSEGILLEDSNGQARVVPGPALAHMFRNLKDNIQVVVFNACFSQEQAREVADYIDVAVGMGEAIGDSAAIAFSSAFYMGLGYGRSVQSAFDIGVAELMIEGLVTTISLCSSCAMASMPTRS